MSVDSTLFNILNCILNINYIDQLWNKKFMNLSFAPFNDAFKNVYEESPSL